MTTETTLSDIPQFLVQLREERFFGRVSFDLRDGEVVLIRTERTQLVSSKVTKSNHQGGPRDEYEPPASRE
jgi:hypothetical protein